MTLRWILAAIHLLGLAIGLGAVWARAGAFRATLDRQGLARLFAADTWWGISALLLLTTGLYRLLAGSEKIPAFYFGNHLFWGKMGLLALILVLEVAPMVTLIRWRRLSGAGQPVDGANVARYAATSHVQAALLVVMIVMATGMARGFGAIGDRKDRATGAAAAPGAWTDPSPHQERMIAVNGARLEVLDWGGTGPALVLIHGLGDSPHIWDDLAIPLAKSFRVVAYARRGHAGSDKVGPYDNTTLTNDLVGLLDSLEIRTASYVGWSMGGNEITELAVRHPDRVNGLVYVDAGYEWSDPAVARAFGAFPSPINPMPPQQVSLDSLRAFYQRTWLPGLGWPPSWEAHVRDLVDILPDGSTRMRQSDSLTGVMFESLMAFRKDFKAIKAPALSLWAESFLPVPSGDTAAARQSREWDRGYFAEFRDRSIRRFRSEVARASDTTLPGTNHASLGVVDVDGVAGLIRDFLTRNAR